MTIYIRQAKPQDARVVAPIIVEAIGDIVKRLTGEQSPPHVRKTKFITQINLSTTRDIFTKTLRFVMNILYY